MRSNEQPKLESEVKKLLQKGLKGNKQNVEYNWQIMRSTADSDFFSLSPRWKTKWYEKCQNKCDELTYVYCSS